MKHIANQGCFQMKTLDEAILHCYEKALQTPLYEYSEEYIQLARWLEELKSYRETIKWVERHDEELSDNSDEWHGIHIAIKEIKKRVKGSEESDILCN